MSTYWLELGMRWLLGLVGFLWFSPGLLAQTGAYITNTQTLDVKDGLSHRMVYCVHQDTLGFIWIGTAFGLNRYDGYEFQRYTVASHSLQSNNIQAILKGSEGYLWLMEWEEYLHESPLKTVHLFHPISHETISFEEKLGDLAPFDLQQIHQITRLSDDRLLFHGLGRHYWTYAPASGFKELHWPSDFRLVNWMSPQEIWGKSAEQALIKINESGNILTRIGLENPNPVSEVLWQKNARDSSLWILQPLFQGNPGALTRWKNGSISDAFPLKKTGFLGPRSTARIQYRASDQTIWYVEGVFLWIIDKEGKLLYGLPENPPKLTEKRIHQVFIDRQGHGWFSTAEGITLMHFEKSPFSRLGNKSNPIWAPQKGASGTRGILQLDNWLLFNRYVFSSVIDLNSGRGRDLYKELPPFDTKIKRQTHAPDRVGGPRIPLIQDRQGRLWTAAEGLIRLNQSGEEIASFPSPQEGNTAWSLYQDTHNTFWLGLTQGLAWVKPETQSEVQPFTAYHEFESLRNALVLHFYEEKADKIWLASSNGLYVLDPQHGITARYGDMESGEYHLPARNFHYVYQDEEGIYWLCTKNKGLIRWEPQAEDTAQRIQQFTREDGLPDDELYGIFEDKFNHLWISSAYGLIHFNKASYISRIYYFEDGITNNEFNRASYFQAQDGSIYFGSIDGITVFHPKDFFSDLSYHQPLRLSVFQQYDGDQQQLKDRTRQLQQHGKIILKPNDRFFSLKVSLMEYLLSSKVKYEYLIDGLEAHWQSMRNNQLTISGLPYGNYTLRLRARGVDGRYSTRQLDFPLVVEKPFYLTTGFLLSMVLGMLLVVWLTVRLRTRRLIRQQKLLEEQVRERTRQIAEDKKVIEQQAEELRELDRLKSRFFTNISHEFRTPLTVMLGMVAQINENPVRWLNKGLELIKRNGTQLLDLINQIMDLRKLESQSLLPYYQQGDIIAYLRYIAESFQSAGHQKNLQLSFESDIESLEMDFDAEKLLRIVNNLLSNAIKFTPDEGRIRLVVSGAGRQQIRDTLTITVSDTGIGIPKENIPFVFGRFYQADEASKQAGEGTGIGLSLVKELVILLGGEVSVYSEMGKGSQFVVSLPITNTAPRKEAAFKPLEKVKLSQPIALPTSSPEEGKHSILVVEDNLDVRNYLESLLAETYQVHVADDGREGIEKALALVPDLIISDVMMPHVDGFELCQRLKMDERSSHIPIVLLTARADIESRISGWERGADAYLAKPFDQKELATVLKKLLELRQILQARYQQLEPVEPSEDTAIQKEDAFIQQIHAIILERLDDSQLNIQTLCSLLGMSRTQLHNKLKALTGLSTTRYLKSIRLKEAQKLLQDPNLRISDIAYQVGFNDPAYFSNMFTKEFGRSPREARNSPK